VPSVTSSCAARDQLQRPAEVVEHGVVDDRDRDHQGDPGGDPADDQRGPAPLVRSWCRLT
jgi:hypothetical protein